MVVPIYLGLPKSGLGPVLTPTAQDRTTSGPDIWANVKDQTGPASGPNYRSSPGPGLGLDQDQNKTYQITNTHPPPLKARFQKMVRIDLKRFLKTSTVSNQG